MQNNHLLKKSLVCAVILLFIAVSFQPIIAEKTVSAEKESDYNNENKYEYIIEITKENKVISYSVFLTETQANDLDILIDSIHLL